MNMSVGADAIFTGGVMVDEPRSLRWLLALPLTLRRMGRLAAIRVRRPCDRRPRADQIER
jgi:hypothetical protein